MYKLRHCHGRVGAHEHGRGRGRGQGRGESGDINAVPSTLIILTPSIPEPSSSIPSPPSAPPASAAPSAASVSSSPCPSLHSSTASHLQSKNVRGGIIGKGTVAMVATMGRLTVELDYDIGRPTNKEISSKLTSECAYLVRKHTPLHVEAWTQIDENERKRIRDLLQFKFDIDLEDERYVNYVNTLMGKAYSDFRHRLHIRFLEFETIKAAKRSTPPLGVKEVDWHRLCDFFGTNAKYLHCSLINKKIRENVPYSHYGGSKPFVYHLQEKSKEDMHQRRSQLHEEGFESVDENVITDEVLGTRARYIPGMGYGPKLASYSLKRQPSPGYNCFA